MILPLQMTSIMEPCMAQVHLRFQVKGSGIAESKSLSPAPRLTASLLGHVPQFMFTTSEFTLRHSTHSKFDVSCAAVLRQVLEIFGSSTFIISSLSSSSLFTDCMHLIYILTFTEANKQMISMLLFSFHS